MPADTNSLENAFEAWSSGLNTGDLDAFWDAFDAEAEILDEDELMIALKEEDELL